MAKAMRKLNLDFEIQPRKNAWTGWALLLIGAALCGEMLFSYVKLQQEVNGLEKILVKNGLATKKIVPQKGVASYTPIEFTHAQEVIAKIAIPWGDLFRAVESVKVERVALLDLEPDAKTGTLLLRGEAGDLPALLTYIARLSRAKQLYEVYLVRHEVRRDGDPTRPIVFSISARWGVGS